MKIKCIVCGVNLNGCADYFPIIVEVSEEDYNLGEHYGIAETKAIEKGYETPCLIADEKEPLFDPFLNLVDWRTVTEISA